MSEKLRGEYGRGRVYQQKGGKVWRIRYRHDGKAYEESSGSRRRQDAVALLNKRLGEVQSRRFIPDAQRLTFADLERMVLDDYVVKARRSAPPLTRLREHFGLDARALDITPDRVTAYVRKRLDEGAAPQTVRNEVAVLGRAFTLAYRAGKFPHRPYLETPRVNNARTGFFTQGELDRLLDHLPAYLRPFVETAYITGWRRSELLNLRWSQIDWEMGTMRLERGTTKSGEPRTFPFAAHPRLDDLLHQQRAMTTEHERATDTLCPWVFHRDGQQVRGWYYDSWRTACRKAGLDGRRVHDFRRTAVRNLVRAGVSEQVAQTLSGHKTRAIFDRYNITSAADQIEAVRRLATFHGEREPRKVVAVGRRR